MQLTKKARESFNHAILKPETIEEVIEWMRENLKPEDVFEQTALCIWAEQNGYKKNGHK